MCVCMCVEYSTSVCVYLCVFNFSACYQVGLNLSEGLNPIPLLPYERQSAHTFSPALSPSEGRR